MAFNTLKFIILGSCSIAWAGTPPTPAERISVAKFEPPDVDYSSLEIVIPRSAVKGDCIWVVVTGGVRSPGIYFIERGGNCCRALVKDLFRRRRPSSKTDYRK